MARVQIDQASRRFGSVAALDRVSLDVEDGEFCVIVGPSGCGKSTLLRAVAGLEAIDSGTIRIGEADVTRLPPRERDVAFVFQSYALYPHLTARQNLEFPLRVRGVSASERDQRVREAAALLAIDDILDRKPRELSGGQRQRVAMGRAVVRRPKVFLFDEPLSNLDARLRARTRLELADLHRRLGATALYVTHDQAEAMTLGQKVVVMEKGRIRQLGTPRELYDRPADEFVAGFLGSPGMNFFSGEVRNGRFDAPGTSMEAPAALPAGAVVLGVRPEDWQVGDGPFELEVVAIEDLGADRFVFGRIGGADAVYRAEEGMTAPRPGEHVRLAPRAGRMHWFSGGERVNDA